VPKKPTARLGPIPFFGSYQRGLVFRSGNPLDDVWRRVERLGTIDSLEKVAKAKGHDPDKARVGALRIRQAVEFRRLARLSSPVTKPLLLYYSALNLVRGLMLAFTGDFGHQSHGLRFESGDSLLACKAAVTKRGTFRRFIESLHVDLTKIEKREFSLADVLASLVDMIEDYPLLNAGLSSIVPLSVEGYENGETNLRFFLSDMGPEEFGAKWKGMFPWLESKCELADDPFCLKVTERLGTFESVSKFCDLHFLPSNDSQDDPIWFDERADLRRPIEVTQRGAYLLGLFILSNVSRYEPEFLDVGFSSPTDLGFVIATFLEKAERYFPQLILGLPDNRPVYFR